MSNIPNDRDVLQKTLKTMARQDAGRGASAEVEAHLRQQVRSLRATRRTTRLVWAVAASLLVVIGVTRFGIDMPERGSDDSTVLGLTDSSSGFLPLPNAHIPMADAHVVRMTVSRASLAAFGLDPGGPGSPDVVMADVLVGHDGIARSVRFVGLATKGELSQ